MKYWYCVLDFEATCWEDPTMRPQMEIIEFPSVLICYDSHTKKCETISEFREFCQPVVVPILSEFCTGLTGITQEQVSGASSFPEVYARHWEWLKAKVPADSVNNVKIITCGAWDINVMLPMEFARYSELPKHHPYTQYINIKKEFEYCYDRYAGGMANMLSALKIPLDGRHHSGIDDTRNIAKILIQILCDGHFDFQVRRVADPRKAGLKQGDARAKIQKQK